MLGKHVHDHGRQRKEEDVYPKIALWNIVTSDL